MDFGAYRGAGVDAIHVWAFRASDGAPTFVGAASYGATRADVGAVFGSQFTNSGYNLTAALPPGDYNIVVYAHSLVSGSFNQSRAVRVTIQ